MKTTTKKGRTMRVYRANPEYAFLCVLGIDDNDRSTDYLVFRSRKEEGVYNIQKPRESVGYHVSIGGEEDDYCTCPHGLSVSSGKRKGECRHIKAIRKIVTERLA